MTKPKPHPKGHVTIETYKKGFNDFSGDNAKHLRDGDIFWTVHDGEGGGMDVLEQVDAEMLGSLWKLEVAVKKINTFLEENI